MAVREKSAMSGQDLRASLAAGVASELTVLPICTVCLCLHLLPGDCAVGPDCLPDTATIPEETHWCGARSVS